MKIKSGIFDNKKLRHGLFCLELFELKRSEMAEKDYIG